MAEGPFPFDVRGVILDRVALDLTAVYEICREMTRLAGENAELVLRNTGPDPLTLEKLEDPSPVYLDGLHFVTARRLLREGVLQEGPGGAGGDGFAWITLLTSRPATNGTLHVRCQDPQRLDAITHGLARMVVRLGRPRPNAAGSIWSLAVIAIAALLVLPLVAAVVGVLHPLLWAPTLVLGLIGSFALVQWARPLVQRLSLERDVVLVDPSPRREVRLARANHRRDARVAALGFGSALLLALLVYLLGIK
ncbi:hypothetical protein [Blastococcus brunescens]|uniref:TIGR04222 domain-containing membrane protein n=1 Tax=Blastococcus brunescens TaxID=1564165 RepID=A0ABZ1B4B2_9ACTN|nr:hypothetical protein [Blastococcus sp. BMG 8361]WRL65637.1 hypothetical protein U6N30_08675 [Blastococcus sp. BMG 8361]